MDRAYILVVDGQGDLLLEASRQLSPTLYEIEAVRDISAVLARVQSAPLPDLVLLETAVGEPSLEHVIRQIRQIRPSLKIVVQARPNDFDQVVKAIQMGANAWVWKPMQDGDLGRAVSECFRSASERLSPGRERPGDVAEFYNGAFFVAASPVMRKLRADLERVARIEVPVLCLGESGTGKEVAARWLHQVSARASQTFLKVNCAAVPAELLESELFGYERGAFTGAVRAKPGKFELCHNGTLFLDEVAEMPAALQAKLLHVVQDQEFVRLGGCQKVKVAVRIIAATNVKIKEALAEKRFREDLYYRLSVFVFEIPPLRERTEDIPILLRRYLALHARTLGLPERALPTELWQRCLRYEWPGNVRQLENFAKRYLLFGEEAAEFDRANLSLEPGNPGIGEANAPEDLKAHVRGMRDGAEASAIGKALEQTNWNRKAAADLLKISYKSLLLKIRQHRLDE